MYAIIKDGGRQYQVQEGQELDVDYRDLAAGAQFQFGQVLALRDDAGLKIGSAALGDTAVTAEVVGPVRGPKLVMRRFRRRKNLRKKKGHRQLYTRVRIRAIGAPAAQPQAEQSQGEAQS